MVNSAIFLSTVLSTSARWYGKHERDSIPFYPYFVFSFGMPMLNMHAKIPVSHDMASVKAR
jgi:hypothetical protein